MRAAACARPDHPGVRSGGRGSCAGPGGAPSTSAPTAAEDALLAAAAVQCVRGMYAVYRICT
eukprot:jgi/Chlat1/8094/Chrsp75S07590